MKKASEFQSIQEYLDALGFLVEGEYFVYGPVPTVRIHVNYIDGHTPASFAKAMRDGRCDAHWGGKGGDTYQDVVQAIFAEEHVPSLSSGDMNYNADCPDRVSVRHITDGTIDIVRLSPEKAARLKLASMHGSPAQISFDRTPFGGDKTVRPIALSSQDQKTMDAIRQTERAWNSFLASPPGVSFVTNIEARHQEREGLLSIRKELQEKVVGIDVVRMDALLAKKPTFPDGLSSGDAIHRSFQDGDMLGSQLGPLHPLTSVQNTSVDNCIADNRLGRFFISSWLLRTPSSHELSEIFKHFVIVRAEHLWAEDKFDYSAYSPLFAVCDPGVTPPTYEIIVSYGVSGTTVEARRKS